MLKYFCCLLLLPGFRRRSRPEPGYLAGARAVTLARLRLHLKFTQIIWNLTSFDVFSKVNINYDLNIFKQFVVSFKNSKIMFSFTRNWSRPKTGRLRNPGCCCCFCCWFCFVIYVIVFIVFVVFVEVVLLLLFVFAVVVGVFVVIFIVIVFFLLLLLFVTLRIVVVVRC